MEKRFNKIKEIFKSRRSKFWLGMMISSLAFIFPFISCVILSVYKDCILGLFCLMTSQMLWLKGCDISFIEQEKEINRLTKELEKYK